MRGLKNAVRSRTDIEHIIQRIRCDEEFLRDVPLSRHDRESRLRSKAIRVMCDEGMVCTGERLQEIVSILIEEMLGLGPLEPLLRDSEVSEIMVNGTGQSYIERCGVLHRVELGLRNEEQIYSLIDRIVGPLGLRVDESSPFVDARLPDGSRVNVIVPPLSLGGPLITIRKFSPSPITLEKLVESKDLAPELGSFLSSAVRRRLNIIISGGTGSGKTTLLNALSAHIPSSERIITIEDAAELRLQQEHVIRLEARPPNLEGKGEVTVRDLLRNALRMRPDRIVIGEVRGEEALDMLQAMNTGHEGSLSTVHSNSSMESIYRIETMAMMAGRGLSSSSVSSQIRSAIDLLVHLARRNDGSRRIIEVSCFDNESPSPGPYPLRRLFQLRERSAGKGQTQERLVDPVELNDVLSRRSAGRFAPEVGGTAWP